MYRAKEQGRNNYQFYTAELTTSAFERVLLENQLRHAIDNDELDLVYQPQVNLKDARPIGVEVLLRWRHPQHGTIAPGRFIPTAERSGLILPIGKWVLENSCRQAQTWLKSGIDIGRLAINVSGAQIQRSEFVETVEQALTDTGLDPQRLELEVTESFIMTQADQGIRTLESLRALGITLAIDDFGTGYSSLSHLKQLPIQRLKIDKSFVCDIPNDANDLAITRAVIALGNSLQLQIIAEGVETEEQKVFLLAEGCHEAQGYLFSYPLAAVDVPRFFS
jgi:EAL domain-containing protein (putative c-di-GMP-specific phosphodiesterase class I)